jgi:hypothetical protein
MSSALSLSKSRFGFMEQRKDVKEMIAGLDFGLQYAGIVGQAPSLHSWLMGNTLVAKILVAQPFLKIADPLRTMVDVSINAISPPEGVYLIRE